MREKRGRTLNDVLRELDQHGIPYSKVASGYYIGELDQRLRWLLCKCDGNGTLEWVKCSCGGEIIACITCLDSGQIFACPQCASKINKKKRIITKAFDMPEDEIEKLVRISRQNPDTPIDLGALVAEGKLAPISDTEYKLLVPFRDLPEHALAQIDEMDQKIKDDAIVETILRFRQQQRPKQ